MHTGHAFHLLEFFDLLTGELDAFFGNLALAGSLEPFDNLIGHIHARHLGFHITGHTHAFHGRYPGQNIHFFRQSHVIGLADPFAKFFHVVNALGLDKIHAGFYFFGQPMHPPFKGFSKRVGGRPDKYLRWFFNLRTTQKLALIAHSFDHADQLHGIDVEHTLGIGVVPEFLVIAGQAQHVVDAVGICAQNIALHGQPVTVAANHLEIGFQAFLD